MTSHFVDIWLLNKLSSVPKTAAITKPNLLKEFNLACFLRNLFYNRLSLV